MAKAPREKQQELLPQVRDVYYAASYESAHLLAVRSIERFAKDYLPA